MIYKFIKNKYHFSCYLSAFFADTFTWFSAFFFQANFWLSAVSLFFFLFPFPARMNYHKAIKLSSRKASVCVQGCVWGCGSVNVSICHFCSQLFCSQLHFVDQSRRLRLWNAFVPCARFIVTRVESWVFYLFLCFQHMAAERGIHIYLYLYICIFHIYRYIRGGGLDW